MKITVTVEVGERYDSLAKNEVSLDLPGEGKKGASLIKDHITGFIQDACDILIPKTISDMDERIENAYAPAAEERTSEVTPDGSAV